MICQREADHVFIILEVASNLIEQLAWQADRPGTRHQSRQMCHSKEVVEKGKRNNVDLDPLIIS